MEFLHYPKSTSTEKLQVINVDDICQGLVLLKAQLLTFKSALTWPLLAKATPTQDGFCQRTLREKASSVECCQAG